MLNDNSNNNDVFLADDLFEDIFEDTFEDDLVDNLDSFSDELEVDDDLEINDLDIDNIDAIDSKFQVDFDDSIEYEDFDDIIVEENIDNIPENLQESSSSLSREDKRIIELVKYRKDDNAIGETVNNIVGRISTFIKLFKKYAYQGNDSNNNLLLSEIQRKTNVLNISVTDKYYYMIENCVIKIVIYFDKYSTNHSNEENIVNNFMNCNLPKLIDNKDISLSNLAEGNRDAYNYLSSFVRDLYELKLKLVGKSNTKNNESFNVYEYYLNLLLNDVRNTWNIIKTLYEAKKDSYLDDFVFVTNIDTKANKYTCGHCGRHIEADRPFYLFTLIPAPVKDSEIYNLLPCVNVCPHCSYVNTLSKKELEKIEEVGSSDGVDVKVLRGSFKEQRPHGLCYTERELSSNKLVKAVPNCFEYSSDVDFDAIQEEIQLLNWRAEINSYRSLLEYLRYSDTNLAERTSDNLPIDEEKTVQYIARMMCSVLNLDYTEYYNKAIDSCIKHLSDSTLNTNLSYSTVATIKMANKNKDLIDKLKDMDDTDFRKNVLALYYNYGYTDFSKIEEESRSTIINRLNELHNNFLTRIEISEQKQMEYLNQLDEYFFELGSIPITNDKINHYTRLNLTYNSKMMNIISKIANSMIIFNLAEDFFQTWFVSFRPVGTSRNADNNRGYKEVNGFAGDPNEFYDILFKAVKPIDNSYGKYLQKFENIEEYIIPDFDVLELLDDLVKLKIDIVSDEYKTFMVLDKILSEKYYETQPILARHLSKLEKLKDDIHNLVSYYGTISKSRLYYYFDGIFTRDEIDNDYNLYMDSVQVSNIIPRGDNETFKEYMDRMNNFKIGDCECIDNSNELAYRLSEYFVDIECVISLALHITDQSNDKLYNIITFLTIILSLKKYYNHRDIIEMFGYSEEVVNYLMLDSDIKESTTNEYDLSFFKQAIDISSIIYNDEEINESLSNCGVDAIEIQNVLKENEENIELFCKYYNSNLARELYEFIGS